MVEVVRARHSHGDGDGCVGSADVHVVRRHCVEGTKVDVRLKGKQERGQCHVWVRRVATPYRRRRQVGTVERGATRQRAGAAVLHNIETEPPKTGRVLHVWHEYGTAHRHVVDRG